MDCRVKLLPAVNAVTLNSSTGDAFVVPAAVIKYIQYKNLTNDLRNNLQNDMMMLFYIIGGKP